MPDRKQYAVIIINSDVKKEQRVIKTIEALHKVDITPVIFSYTQEYKGCICLPYIDIEGPKSNLKRPVLIRKIFSLRYRILVRKQELFNKWFYSDYKKVAGKMRMALSPYEKDTVVVVAHHFSNLPVGAMLSKSMNVKLVFNAHEYYPEQFSGTPSWHIIREKLNWVGHHFLKYCHRLFTVCDGILKRYGSEFSLSEDKQVLVTNATMYCKQSPTPTGEKIRLIHHGVAGVNRKLELMLDVADLVDKDRFEFHFMLVPSVSDMEYFEGLKQQIESRDNCFFVDPVPTLEIPAKVNNYDLGFYVYDDNGNFNMKHYLPNKLFEFIQGRLGIVIGPYVEMKSVVEEYGIGVVSATNDLQEIANMINALTKEQVDNFKKNTERAAVELSGEKQIDKMAAVFSEIKKSLK